MHSKKQRLSSSSSSPRQLLTPAAIHCRLATRDVWSWLIACSGRRVHQNLIHIGKRRLLGVTDLRAMLSRAFCQSFLYTLCSPLVDLSPCGLILNRPSIADLANISRAEASALLREFKANGMIDVDYRYIRITAPASLATNVAT